MIATGGGAYVDPRTRELLNERAITVWLDAPVDILAERTVAPRHPRPASERRSQGDARAAREGAAPLLRRGAHPREKRRRRAQASGRGDRRARSRSISPAQTPRPASRLSSSGNGRSAPKDGPEPACRSPVCALPLQPFAIAHAIFALDPVDLALVDAARLQRRPAHDDRAFEQLALGKGEVEPVELDQVHAGRMPGPSPPPAERPRAPPSTASRVSSPPSLSLQKAMTLAVSAPAVRSRSMRRPSP